HSGSVKSAHDCSEGGLAVAVAESCISGQVARETSRLIGARLDLTPPPSNGSETPHEAVRLDALLFGETQGRLIISVSALNAGKVLAQAQILGIPAARIGTVGGDQLIIKSGDLEVSWTLAELHDLWWNSIARAMR